MEKFEEYYKVLFNYKGVEVADINHAIERFKERHTLTTGMQIDFLYARIREAIDKILFVYKGKIANYMAVSKSTNLKISIEYRPDRYEKGKMVAAIPTILDKEENPRNLRNEIVTIVEQDKDVEMIGVE